MLDFGVTNLALPEHVAAVPRLPVGVDYANTVGDVVWSLSCGEQAFEGIVSVSVGKGFHLNPNGVLLIPENNGASDEVTVNSRSNKQPKGLIRERGHTVIR